MKKRLMITTAVALGCMLFIGCNTQNGTEKALQEVGEMSTSDMLLYVKYGDNVYWQTVMYVDEVEIESLKGDKIGETVYKDLNDVNAVTTTEEIKKFPDLSSNVGTGAAVFKVKGEDDRLLVVFGENSGEIFKAEQT